MLSLFSIVLAVLGLSFLVFIHELGHYWVAKRKKMRVEVFSIGFGKPIYSWRRGEVLWQIGILPFGGYVKIAGMQKEGSREPYEISDGFYGKKPWDRIQVAFAGPFVNIVFALLAFTAIWMLGGLNKNFTEVTHRIGWVDPQSALYQNGVRPGDVITRYDGKEFEGFKSLVISSLMSHEEARVEGYKVDSTSGRKLFFDYTLKKYADPRLEKGTTIGVLSPAQYLYLKQPLLPGSPMEGSGIEPGDRILWADGEMLFSVHQLSQLINDSTAFLTVQRGEAIFHTKVPRVQLEDLKMSPVEKGELDDWQHEAHLKGRLQDLYFIPYFLSPEGLVEKRMQFIDEQDQLKTFQKCNRCAYFHPLEEGDKIIAVEGVPTENAYQLLSELQTRKVLVIVERAPAMEKRPLWNQADEQFGTLDQKSLRQLVGSIGTENSLSQAGSLFLLHPVAPKKLSELELPPAQKLVYAEEVAETRKQIEAIQDPQKRTEALHQFEMQQNKLVLGVPLKDLGVVYNPSPFSQLIGVFKDTYQTLAGLFSGGLSPKYMSGPVGIVHVVQQSWLIGFKEALYWLAVISLNLAFVNLLPIPVLDGGHIVFSCVEFFTKRPIKAKTMERMIIPFVALLIGLFVYITYQDLTRLFSKFF